MKKAFIAIIVVGLITTPVQAADWSDTRPGAFVGARLTIGGRTAGRPQAALTLAPTQNRISHNGLSSMRIGEGLAFNLTPDAKPTLTLAGVRADTALGLNWQGEDGEEDKGGLPTAAWVAIGVVAAVGATALYFVDYCNDNEATLCGDEE